MLSKFEDFLYNKLAGKLMSRASVSLAGLIVAWAAKGHITLDPLEVAGALVIGGQALFDVIKHWRNKDAPVAAPAQ